MFLTAKLNMIESEDILLRYNASVMYGLLKNSD